tara:strand:- start:1114 stop:1464 length:351 start_codon:yes stop_codon:yes gene_type:complete
VAESVVPMINVVFLLLIFFMMSATIMPAPPFDVTLPETNAQRYVAGETDIYISASGDVSFQDALNDDAWALLAAQPATNTVTLRADAKLSAVKLARVVSRLSQIGHAQIEIAIRVP